MKLSPGLTRKVEALATTPRVKTGSQERVTLPLPPSTNALFVAGVNRKTGKPQRWKSPEYKQWLAIAVPILQGLRPPAAYPCVCMVFVTGNVNRQRDGSNLIKAVEDAAVKAGVIPDDSLKWIGSGHWLYEPSEGEPSALVWFEAMLGAKGVK